MEQNIVTASKPIKIPGPILDGAAAAIEL